MARFEDKAAHDEEGGMSKPLRKVSRCGYCGETFDGEWSESKDSWSEEPREQRNEHIKDEHYDSRYRLESRENDD